MPAILPVILMVALIALLIVIKKYIQDLHLHFELPMTAANMECHLHSLSG